MRANTRVVYNNIPQYKAQVRQRLTLVLDKTAQDVSSQSEAQAPRVTGKLAAGHYVTTLSEWVREVGNSTEYAGWVNFGTRFMAARPYFTSSVERARPIFRQAVAQALRP